MIDAFLCRVDARQVNALRAAFTDPAAKGFYFDSVSQTHMPKAVVCLLSALQFHEIGTQLPHEVWIALPQATQTPAIDYPSLRIARLRGAAYSEAIEIIVEHGSPIRVYSLAKTITDCFKFRHKIGLDIALEALKEAWHQRKLNIDDVMRYAKINRVARVMQPYLETVFSLWYDQPHRPTRDADLLGSGPDDKDSLITTFRDVTAIAGTVVSPIRWRPAG